MFIEIKGRWSNAKTYNKTKLATKFSSSKLVNKQQKIEQRKKNLQEKTITNF